MRRLAVLITVVGVAMGTASNALALTGKPWADLTTLQKTQVKQQLLQSYDWSAAETDLASGGMEAATAAGVVDLTSVTVIPQLAVAATAGYVAYRIARPTLGGYVARLLFGSDGYDLDAYRSPFTGAFEWYHVSSPAAGSGAPGPLPASEPGWQFRCNGGTACYGEEYNATFGPYVNANASHVFALTSGHHYAGWPSGGACSGDCSGVFRTDAEMAAAIHAKPATYTGDPADYAGTIYPSTAITDSQAQAALDAIGWTAPTTSAGQAAVNYIGDHVPGVTTDSEVVLQPLPNETYTAYIARLRADGYVGTATTTVEGSALSGYGPQAVTRVTYTEGGVTHVLDPLSWPTPEPEMFHDTALTVRYNPDTATPAPTDTAPPGDYTGTPGSVDFTPLTTLNPGCKFPYGFICYAEAVTGWFNVSPAAPEFDFTIPGFNVGGTTLGPSSFDYNVSLSVMDPYMAVIRLLEEIAIGVGAVYLVATRLLGFHAGGDPGEAVDEAISW